MAATLDRGIVSDETKFPLVRISNVALVAFAVAAFLAIRRWQTFHNETFDLAFYARWVWGAGHGDPYQPLTNSNVAGLHAAPILSVLGTLGRVLPIVPMLLTLQAASVIGAGIPLARIAARRAAHPLAADVALVAYLLFPTVSTITTYEFHPGALALFPLAHALDCFDRRRIRPGIVALGVAVLCREDVALVAAFAGLSLAVDRRFRLTGAVVFVAGVAWFGVYMFLIAPRHLPRHGSLELHYRALGTSPRAIVHSLFVHPLATLRAVSSPAKLLYLPRMLAPVAFLSLLAPRWLLPALPVYAINYLSQFPTAVQIQSHYAALALPFIFASAAHGAGRLAASDHRYAGRLLVAAAIAVGLGTMHMHRRAGATPLSRRWDASAFRSGTRATELRDLLARVPRDASIAAPDYVLPHVSLRSVLVRIPFTREVDWVLLSAEHRRRFSGGQDLWRNQEEILIRNMIAGSTYGVYAASSRHILLRLRYDVRSFATGTFVQFAPRADVRRFHREIGPSLTLAGYGVRSVPNGSVVRLLIVPPVPWPHDLGLEIGWGPMHPNGDRLDPVHIVSFLPFGGVFSPVHVRAGEVAQTEVFVPAAPNDLQANGLYFGARRLDGSRLDAASAHWTALAAPAENP